MTLNQSIQWRRCRGFSVVKWLVVLALLGGGGYGAYFYFFKRTAEAAVEYRTATVAKGDIVQTVTANGSLNPVRLVEIGSQISGVITAIKVDFNSKVKEGDVVAQIDPATYERALGQAEAELTNAEAARELAKLNYDRAKELFDNSLISKSEYDQARVSLLQADASVKTREANVDRAKVDLSRTTIYAPMDGIIISRKVEAGQTVAASMNAPTLFIMANDLAQMQIEAAVSEADVGGVEEGQKVTFDVDAFPGRQFSGSVQQVRFAPTTNQNVVSYTTVVAVENKDLKLRPGMTANAKFITAERRGIITVPNAALRFRPPEGANVKTPAGAKDATPEPKAEVELATSGPFAGLPVQPWAKEGQFRRPTEEERTAYMNSLTPEQKKKYEEVTAQMRARFAQGGGAGGAGGAGGGGRGGGGFGGGPGGGEGFGGGTARRRSAQTEGPKTGTVYVVEKETNATGGAETVLRQVSVKLGISDGTSTELVEGLKEGETIAVGTATVASAAATPARNPLNPFSNRPRR